MIDMRNADEVRTLADAVIRELRLALLADCEHDATVKLMEGDTEAIARRQAVLYRANVAVAAWLQCVAQCDVAKPKRASKRASRQAESP